MFLGFYVLVWVMRALVCYRLVPEYEDSEPGLLLPHILSMECLTTEMNCFWNYCFFAEGIQIVTFFLPRKVLWSLQSQCAMQTRFLVICDVVWESCLVSRR